jgi:dipeptidyl aminopeptidase/acylaminoacyl peptidase
VKSLLFFLACVGGLLAAADTAAADPTAAGEPLPIDVALSVHGHVARSSFAFSPDGRWIAHTVSTADPLTYGSAYFSRTGTSRAEGAERFEAHVTNVRTGQEVRLGDPASSSWAPVWSPDGRRIAFFSDKGGSAGLWVWSLATRRAQRFPGVIVRPFFGLELPRWSGDGRTILCKILPPGMSIAQANMLIPSRQTARRFPAHGPEQPGVLVYRSNEAKASGSSDDTPTFLNRSLADLALLDLQTHRIKRIAHAARVAWYGFSPDQRWIAYTHIERILPNSQQPTYRIDLIDRNSGERRTLARGVAMSYGTELSWSPDSRSLAMIDSDAGGIDGLSIVPLNGAPARRLLPVPGLSETPPRWSEDGRSLYANGTGGRLWQVDVLSGAGKPIASLPDVEITDLVTKFGSPSAWTTDHGRFLWAFGSQAGSGRASIVRIDASTGAATSEPLPIRDVEPLPSIDANDREGEIAFVATGKPLRPADLWTYTIGAGARQISHLNPEMESYAAGEARVMDVRTAKGGKLHATLLLPPGYVATRPLSTVVWVYPGNSARDSIRSFGLGGESSTFNMHILTTRGYAVLIPDMPLDKMPVEDILDAVIPAVDAAVAQGYSDPDRLAVMGQSYGSYAVLALIAHTHRFKAAVVTGVLLNPDLLASYLQMEPDGSTRWIGYLEQGQGDLGGSPWEFRDRYIENSPIYSFDKIMTPLLIGQGAEDGRLDGADAAFVALRRLGKAVEYRLYEGEGHVLLQKANIRDFWRRRLDFLAERLAVKQQ